MPEVTVKTKYYEYSQNNSGGSFDIKPSEGIGPRVWIEATDFEDANRRAENLGLYFEGVHFGWDCPCCGDRWYSKHDESDAEEDPIIEPRWDFNWHDAVYVHRMDGTILAINKDDVPTDGR